MVYKLLHNMQVFLRPLSVRRYLIPVFNWDCYWVFFHEKFWFSLCLAFPVLKILLKHNSSGDLGRGWGSLECLWYLVLLLFLIHNIGFLFFIIICKPPFTWSKIFRATMQMLHSCKVTGKNNLAAPCPSL